ncbi:MAG: hypothetical protein GY953_10355, partial [bacterium]|nr:hypothetical protein [bacterium]
MKRAAGLILGLLLAASSSADPLAVDPSRIEINSFYSGVPVLIEGDVMDGADVVVAIRGDTEDESFNKKVRAGPIWISSGKVHISGAPSLFLTYSGRPLTEVLDREAIEAHALDNEAIMSRLHVDAGGDEVDVDAMCRNYLD